MNNEKMRPPKILRRIARSGLQAWGRLDIAPGYRYVVVEQIGANLGDLEPLLNRLPNGCSMKCELTDHVMRLIYFYGVYEPVESYLFMRLVKPGMVVLDVGANVGQYTLLASKGVGETGVVHSFEPVPSNFARLECHVDENGLNNVHLNRAALWHENVTVKLGRDKLHNDGSFTISARVLNQSVEAPGIRLESYVESNRLQRIDLIKMDVEGAEPAAITGGMSVFRKFRPFS